MDDIIQKFIFIMDSTIVLYLTCTNVQSDNFPRKRRKVIFIFIFLVMLFLSPFLGQVTSVFCFVGIILLLTWRVTFKLQNLLSFLTGYIFTVCFDHVVTTISYSFFRLTIATLRNSLVYCIIYPCYIYFLTRFVRYILHEKLRIQEQKGGGRLWLMVLLNLAVSAAIYVCFIIYEDRSGYPPGVISFHAVLFFLYFILSTALLIFTGRTIQKEARMELQLTQYENLSTYTKEVERLYQNMRAFRHDYISLLSTMKGYIDQNDSVALKGYFYQKILPAGREMTDADNRLGMLGRVKNEPLKSLLSAKMITAQNMGLNVNIEINEDIDDLSIDMTDFIRVMGIFLTNAAEAAVETDEKEVHLVFIGEQNRVTVLVKNTSQPLTGPVHVLMQNEKTTKEGHSGIGLFIAKKILDSYKNIQWKASYDAPYFTVQINIYNDESPRN